MPVYDGTVDKIVGIVNTKDLFFLFSTSGAVLLEVFVFDFSGDLYGAEIAVELRAFIRPEVKFSGLDALKAQIAADAAEARRLLAEI